MNLRNAIKAQNLEQVLNLLGNPDHIAKIIAGGTDLITQLREEKVNPTLLIDISAIPELQFINDDGDYLEIGAATNFSVIARNHLINRWAPGLSHAARGVGSPQIRNRGTIGGNICNGSPAADTVPPLLALDAIVTLQNLKGKRQMVLSDIHRDKGKIDIQPDEVLVSIRLPKLKKKQGLGFHKLGLRKALAISTISLSAFIELDENRICHQIRVASGSLARFPQREPLIEELICNQAMSADLISQVADKFGDILKERLTGRPPVEIEYKPHAVKGVFKTVIDQAVAQTSIF